MRRLSKEYALILLGVVSLVSAGFFFELPSSAGAPSQAAAVVSPFTYTFNSSGILNEAPRMQDSTSPYWWLNSGGRLLIADGIGTTMLGDASPLDRWRVAYALSNPTDTDNGLHPQNIFRLVSRSTWGSARVEAQFKILKDNWSSSPNRNASNGLLLMNRYQDGSTLYYTGVRVDGRAVIKKKFAGTYYTMAQSSVFPGTYVAGGTTNLLPHGEWVGLRSETVTNADGSVTVRLFMRRASEVAWTKLLEAKDTGQYGGTSPIRSEGYLGIRTDFMDVAFDSFRAETI